MRPLLSRLAPGALLLLALIAWFGTLGYRDLIHPDEGRYAEIARQMLASGDWISPRLNGILYFEKPALQYWATATAFAVFGISDFAARFWPGLTGAFAVLALWWTTRQMLGPLIAVYAAGALGSCGWGRGQEPRAGQRPESTGHEQSVRPAPGAARSIALSRRWRWPCAQGVGVVQSAVFALAWRRNGQSAARRRRATGRVAANRRG